MPSAARLRGILWIQLPGVPSATLRHVLCATTAYRDDQPPEAVSADAVVDPVPDELIDVQSTLAGFFPGGVQRRHRRLWRDPGVFRLTLISDPCDVQAAVYRHLVGTDPSLPERKPARFQTLEKFLTTRVEPLTSALAAALGSRKASFAMFDGVLVANDMDPSLRKLAGALAERVDSGADDAGERRQAEIFRQLLAYSGSLTAAFGGPEAPAEEISSALRSEFARRNPRDTAFYQAARERLATGRLLARSRIFPLPVPPRRLVRPSDPVFVFNHLPKSYGTSLRGWLQGAFGMIEDHTLFLGVPDALAEFPASTGRLAADMILCGHFAHGDYLLPRRYPEVWKNPGRFAIFTFVRDPLETAISNYRHVVTRDPATAAAQPALYGSLGSYLAALENPIAKRLGCDADPAAQDRYFFIGAVEAGDAALRGLLERMRTVLDGAIDSATVRRARMAIQFLAGRPLPHANPATGPLPGMDLTAADREDFRQRNTLDYEIHRKAMTNSLTPVPTR